MKLSKVFLVSVFITALILAVIGGLATNVFASRNSGEEINNETIKAYQQREAEYNRLIEQANQQLEQANQDLQALQNQVTQIQQPNEVQQAFQIGISVEKAAEIANQAVPDLTATNKPELVDFVGKTAYEITYEKGSLYIDAQDGAVLFNGTIPQEITLQMAAEIASDFLKNRDIYQTDQITFRGSPLFRVIFNNSTIVYIDKTGQITYILRDSMASRQSSLDEGGGNQSAETSSNEHENHED